MKTLAFVVLTFCSSLYGYSQNSLHGRTTEEITSIRGEITSPENATEVQNFENQQDMDSIKVLPGRGIIINNDSLIFGKSTVRDLIGIIEDDLKIDSFNLVFIGWEKTYYKDMDETELAECRGGYIHYKTIDFFFGAEWNGQELEQDSIFHYVQIRADTSLYVFLDNALILGTVNPLPKDFIAEDIDLKDWDDCIMPDCTNQRTFKNSLSGITCILERVNTDCILAGIKVYPKMVIE